MSQLGIIKQMNFKGCFKSPKKRINPHLSKNQIIVRAKNSLSRNKKQMSPLRKQGKELRFGGKLQLSHKAESEVQKNDGDLINSNKNSENAKTTPDNNSYTLESETELGLTFSNGVRKTANLSLSKNDGRSVKKLFDKKQRKFSDNTSELIAAFESLKAEHLTEERLFGQVLSEKELHRLRKMYSVQQAEYLIQMLNVGRK